MIQKGSRFLLHDIPVSRQEKFQEKIPKLPIFPFRTVYHRSILVSSPLCLTPYASPTRSDPMIFRCGKSHKDASIRSGGRVEGLGDYFYTLTLFGGILDKSRLFGPLHILGELKQRERSIDMTQCCAITRSNLIDSLNQRVKHNYGDICKQVDTCQAQ